MSFGSVPNPKRRAEPLIVEAAASEAALEERRRARARGGREKNILTSPQGLAGIQPVQVKTLLGE